MARAHLLDGGHPPESHPPRADLERMLAGYEDIRSTHPEWLAQGAWAGLPHSGRDRQSVVSGEGGKADGMEQMRGKQVGQLTSTKTPR